MPDTGNTATATAPTTSSGVAVTGKVPLLEMIIATEIEAERLETWARLMVDPEHRMWIARRAYIARMTVRTLDLLRDNEKDFVELIQNKNEVAKRRTKGAK